MLNKLFPSEYVESSYLIDYEELYNRGIRGIIYDIDNTLVEHGAPADERAVELFARLNSIGFKVMAISNNKEPRVKMFCERVKYCDYLFKAGKPSKKGYLKAMEVMKTDVSSTVFIGDQIFTDIWGANRCGIYSYLVKPIAPREEIQIVLKRKLEKPILAAYKKKMRKNNGK